MTPFTWSDYFVGLLPPVFLVFCWLIPVLFALARLRIHKLDEAAKAIWALIILALPVAGPLTYLMLFSPRQGPAQK